MRIKTVKSTSTIKKTPQPSKKSMFSSRACHNWGEQADRISKELILLKSKDEEPPYL